eukprot:Opistho-2@46286
MSSACPLNTFAPSCGGNSLRRQRESPSSQTTIRLRCQRPRLHRRRRIGPKELLAQLPSTLLEMLRWQRRRVDEQTSRIGDTPQIGSGSYADNATCAVSGTGNGDEFIRHAACAAISHAIEFGGMTLQEAVDLVVHGRDRQGMHLPRRKLAVDDGGVIAVNAQYDVVIEFNSPGMYRGCADSLGRFECHIRK